MLDRLTAFVAEKAAIPVAEAHCDIPCRIYDPATALIAALSVVRMVDIVNEVAAQPATDTRVNHNTLARCIAVKDAEAAKVKDEVGIIWGDYFKAAQLEAHPETHGLVHGIMTAASLCKQTVDRGAALALLEQVNRFAEIFWTTKGVAVERKAAPYPPGLPVVRPVL